jgi:hypothetical protein
MGISHVENDNQTNHGKATKSNILKSTCPTKIIIFRLSQDPIEVNPHGKCRET